MSFERPPLLPREIFLSHAGQDHIFTEKIAKLLHEHGLPVWYAPIESIGGKFWHDEIGRALRRCDWFAVILSPNSVQSLWVKRETRYALTDRRFDERIIPILYKPCDLQALSWNLPSIQHVDFTKGFARGRRDLLRIWDLEPRA